MLYGLLREFGDAEIATLIFPRTLMVDASDYPKVDGPPITPGKGGAASGYISKVEYVALTSEWDRARRLGGGRTGRVQS